MIDREQLERKVLTLLTNSKRLAMSKESVCGSIVCLAADTNAEDVSSLLPEEWVQNLKEWISSKPKDGFFLPPISPEREANLRAAMTALDECMCR